MSPDYPTHEQRILVTFRKVLSGIVREITPPAGMRHPLSDKTIGDIKHCFALITAREKELNEAAGNDNNARPRYADEPAGKTSQVVAFTRPKKK